MAKDILKEAIADAKAVREVALANAKAALEEAFTPRLQSMLSAKLSEELEEEEGDDMIDELFEMEYEDEDIIIDKDLDEEVDFSEEIDLEEILNELGLEEGTSMKEGGKDLGDDDDDDDDDDSGDFVANKKAIKKPTNKEHTENFDLDLLLEKINALSIKDNDPEVILEIEDDINLEIEDDLNEYNSKGNNLYYPPNSPQNTTYVERGIKPSNLIQNELIKTRKELSETKSTLETIKSELNEVNLLNAKLLYVNRIFKAHNLSDSQKLRVVETLDKASSTKESKLIYETIKDTFNIKTIKSHPKNSIREGLGIASSAVGLSTAPRKPVLTESNDMVTRMQTLANIKINQ